MRCVFIIVLWIFINSCIQAQCEGNAFCNNKECAVVLTYDDALDVHLDYVIPQLDSSGFKGTFYVTGKSTSLNKRLFEWRTSAKKGHELGNHTLFHPCFGQSKGRLWVKPEFDFDNYTFNRFKEELLICNTLLKAIDGQSKRTFAYTCGDIDFEQYKVNLFLEKNFFAARGTCKKSNNIRELDLYNVNAYVVKDELGKDLINRVKRALKNHELLVFCFHGVGGGHNINIKLSEHRILIDFLKKMENEIWVANMLEVSEYVKNNQFSINE